MNDTSSLKKQHKHKAPSIPFVNNRGKILHMDGNLTLGQLTKMGVKIELVPHGTPLKNGQWRNVASPDFTLL